MPRLNKFIEPLNSNNTANVFEDYLQEIQPDVVHSFALYVSCSPIISVMERYPNQKWIYSSWGSDLYYFQNFQNYLKDIKRVLPRVNYLFTDCKRDFDIATKYGFKGEFLGVFPGGGGYDLETMALYKLLITNRKIILIKGFQGRSGRAIPVLQAVESLKLQLTNFEVVVFGSDSDTFNYVNKSSLKEWANFKIMGKISHIEVLKLMGKSLIYIGNSNSDGIPNTMLEAMCMDVFPIQSNPGGATEEVIQHGINGLLINDCENQNQIKEMIIQSLLFSDFEKLKEHNEKIILNLEYNKVKEMVIQQYSKINTIK